jgi:hypothetical protein
MATNEMARLSPSMPLARGEVSVTTHGAPAGPSQFERADRSLNFSLGFVQRSTGPARPPPPAPTEAQLRARLAQVIEAQHAAGERLKSAESALRRAEAHRVSCQRRAAEFSTLDNELSVAMAEALRAGTDPAAARERFADRLTERAAVLVEATAATAAATTLQREWADASEAAGDLARAVSGAIAAVLACEAERIAVEVRALEAEIESRKSVLVAFDKFSVNRGTMPPTARHVLGTGANAQELYRADMSVWAEAATVLRADPMAAIEIGLPEARVKPLPQPIVYQRVEYVAPEVVAMVEPPAVAPQDDGDPHHLVTDGE